MLESRGIDQITVLNVTTVFVLFLISGYMHPVLYTLLLFMFFVLATFFTNTTKKNEYLLGILMGVPYSPILILKIYLYIQILPKISSLMSFALMIAITFPIILYPKYKKELCERK
jgi:hypothetical protein